MNNTKWVVRKNVNGVPTGPVLAIFDTAEEKTKYMTEHQNAWLDTVDQMENPVPYVELCAYKESVEHKESFAVKAINNHELKINNKFGTKVEAEKWISSYEEAHRFLFENGDTDRKLIHFEVIGVEIS